MQDVLEQAAQWRDVGLGVALATVIQTWGSSPRPAGSQLVVNEKSEFTGSVSGGCVEAAVLEVAIGVIENGAQKVLVDFEKLEYISSAGLRVLLGAAKQLNHSGGELRLSGLNETVQEIFDMSGFSQILAVFKTSDEALTGF